MSDLPISEALLALLTAPWRNDQRILMLEPRRLATRAAAARMAFLLNQPVGQTIGYRTRLDGAGSAETRVEVITEGLLLRRLQSDPGLDVDVIVKAKTDPGYAIAYALLRVAEAQTVIADRLDALGFNANIRDAPGTTEFIGMQIKELVRAVSEVGVALSPE